MSVVGSAKSWRRALVSTAAVGLSALPLAPAAGASLAAEATAQAPTVVAALATAPYGSVLVVGGTSPGLAGAPLYVFTGDADGRFGCTTKAVPSAFDLGTDDYHAFTCTGPESDFNSSGTDDWPALTTTGTALAGRGVNQKLLGTVYRDGIGHQVTYGGHPLYLFDPPSGPFNPGGEDYLETALPLPPWRGMWELVSAQGGQPVPGPATIETETLPDGETALGAQEFPTLVPHAITVYSFSRDHVGASTCTGTCAVTWIPVLTTGKPRVSGAIAAKYVGAIRRPDGTSQVTYNGNPLYLYSGEKIFNVSSVSGTVSYTTSTGTVGNGNGLPGPDGGRFSVIYPG
jgi:predicted lipoprotein with Yx(FWY)xxD motif